MPQHALRYNLREQGALPPKSRFCLSGLWTSWGCVGERIKRLRNVRHRKLVEEEMVKGGEELWFYTGC